MTLLLATEVGIHPGRAIRNRIAENAVSQITAIEGGVLGLLRQYAASRIEAGVCGTDGPSPATSAPCGSWYSTA